MAIMGCITPEITKLPGYLMQSAGMKFTDIPNGLALISKVPQIGSDTSQGCNLRALAGPVAGHSLCRWRFRLHGARGVRPCREAEEVGSRVCNRCPTRFAWGGWALCTALPLRTFESELGVQPPVGFGTLLVSPPMAAPRTLHHRQTELKHGHVSMLADRRYITPEFTPRSLATSSSSLTSPTASPQSPRCPPQGGIRK